MAMRHCLRPVAMLSTHQFRLHIIPATRARLWPRRTRTPAPAQPSSRPRHNARRSSFAGRRRAQTGGRTSYPWTSPARSGLTAFADQVPLQLRNTAHHGEHPSAQHLIHAPKGVHSLALYRRSSRLGICLFPRATPSSTRAAPPCYTLDVGGPESTGCRGAAQG